MTWESFYLVCFGIGFVMSLLAFFGGFGHLHLGHVRLGHVRLGHSGAGHARGTSFSAFNGFSAMAFLCWFGGAGYLLTRYQLFAVPVILLLAVLAGVAGGSIIFLFLVKILLPRERLLLPEDTEMRGVLARVSSSLRAQGTGEILFSLNGTRRCAAARTEDGAALPRNTQVIVLRYEHGIAWVRPFQEFEETNTPPMPT
jgi:hypothetical protein